MLTFNPEKRITMEEALRHPYVAEFAGSLYVALVITGRVVFLPLLFFPFFFLALVAGEVGVI